MIGPLPAYKVNMADPPQLRQVLELQEHLTEASDIDARQDSLDVKEKPAVTFMYFIFCVSSVLPEAQAGVFGFPLSSLNNSMTEVRLRENS